RLQKGQHLDLKSIRVPFERFYFVFVCLPAVLSALVLAFLAIKDFSTFLVAVAIIAAFAVLAWISWKLTLAFLLGHSIKVGPTQYPQIHALVNDASEILRIKPPTVLVMQGHGLFEALVARRFSGRGILILTSNMLDDLTENRSSRELMFFIGRQLG